MSIPPQLESSAGGVPDPAARYRELLADRQASYTDRDRRFRQLGNVRLVVFLAGVVVAWAVVMGKLPVFWIGVPVVGFIALALIHERVHRQRERLARAVAFYRSGLARLDGTWPSAGADGARFRDPKHPYADDLDLFGPGSLFQYLSTARTGAGEATLAAWLRSPASPAVVRARQAAVEELAPLLPLRESLAVEGESARAGLDSERLRQWATHPPVGLGAWLGPYCAVLAPVSVLAVVLSLLHLLPGPIGLGLLLLAWVSAAILQPRVRTVLQGVDAPARDLKLFAVLLERIEAADWTSPALVDLQSRLRVEGVPASAAIRRLRWWVDVNEARRNQLFWPVAAALLLGTQAAVAIEQWRRRYGSRIGSWIDGVGELEALASFAAQRYEHSQDAFPEIDDHGPVVDGEALGHPLIAAGVLVRNDVRLNRDLPLWVVSGSNMSGKSTFLRAIGANVVLALAGAPVRASRFRVSRLQIGASLTNRDSLLEGRSRFFAEILRLRDIVRLTEAEMPVLFLLDELLSGTNSHDRAIGAKGVVQGLVARGAIGLLTTHDLALTAIAGELGARARNVHFEDELEGETLRFDYRLRDGVVQRNNALALMRSIGLEGMGNRE